MKFGLQSRGRYFLPLLLPLGIPPVLFSFYYPLYISYISSAFTLSGNGSVVPGVTSNDITYLYFSTGFVLCLIAQVVFKERLSFMGHKILYLFSSTAANAALCWFFLHLLLP